MGNSLCKILTLFNKLIPKSEKQIAIYGRRMLNDNAEALLDYLIAQHYNDKYEIYLLISKDVYHENYKKVKNVYVCTNAVKTLWVMFRALRVFHTQGTSRCAMRPLRGQIIFNLWHGSPLKAIGKMVGSKVYPETDSYFLSASPFFAAINQRCFGHTHEQMFIGSNPRNDLLFSTKELDILSFLNKNKRLVLFMPTFRNSKGLGRIDANKDFPLLDIGNIHKFDSFLEEKNILFLIKPHPYQNEIPFLKDTYKNICVIYNDDLKRLNVKLYELLGHADALITDFSSVYFDYLLLERPIGFAIDDMGSYKANRGYTVENPFELMPGHKINNIEELEIFITDMANENDTYKESRHQINNLVNTYQTPDASLRILNFVGITK